jgi:hypothetical protein
MSESSLPPIPPAPRMPFVYDDGGRRAAGYRGDAGDCVVRALAIASQVPYATVYTALAQGTGRELRSRGASPRSGIRVRRQWFKTYMGTLGFTWTPTMQIGTGCRVHLAPGELPRGRLVVVVSRHYTAVIDGVIRDTHDPQRTTRWIAADGTPDRVSERCVYGYWQLRPPDPSDPLRAFPWSFR